MGEADTGDEEDEAMWRELMKELDEAGCTLNQGLD